MYAVHGLRAPVDAGLNRARRALRGFEDGDRLVARFDVTAEHARLEHELLEVRSRLALFHLHDTMLNSLRRVIGDMGEATVAECDRLRAVTQQDVRDSRARADRLGQRLAPSVE